MNDRACVVVRFPLGTASLNGVLISNSEMALAIAEQMASHGFCALPNTVGEDGAYEWTVELLEGGE